MPGACWHSPTPSAFHSARERWERRWILAGEPIQPIKKWAVSNVDDGCEVNRQTWYKNGWPESMIRLGRDHFVVYEAGFRFKAEELQQGETVAFARLRLASFGSDISSGARLLIEGVLQTSPTACSQSERPSQKRPKTAAKVFWTIDQDKSGRRSSSRSAPVRTTRSPARSSSRGSRTPPRS